uniref:Inhibitor of growth protein n=1 Tax=Corethrella appendiculata TaxID=1370023 RepID=U5EPY1_9DIPT
MLYLEDYLEMIEHLPQELRDRFTEMREMDLSVQNNMDSLEKRVRVLFQQCRRNELSGTQSETEFKAIRKDYHRVLEDADEKVQLAAQMYDLVERYLRRLDDELHKFKCELEADHNGITEILEKRSLELDTSSNNNGLTSQKENRYFGAITGASAPVAVASRNDTRYRPKPEKRRDSGANLIGAPLEKRQSLSTNSIIQTTSTMRPSTPNLGHAAIPTQTQSVPYNMVSLNKYHDNLGAGNAIAAAASQAIAATQQMQQGRRTASLKASYEAIHGASGTHDLLIGRELAGATHNALQAIERESNALNNQRRQKKKITGNSGGIPSSAVTLGLGSASTPTSVSALLSSTTSGGTIIHNAMNVAVGESSTGNVSSALAGTATNSINVANLNNSLTSIDLLDTSTNSQPITLNENGMVVEQTAEGEWTYDPNEPRYCICNQVSYGDMVACDNEDCIYEWFHYPCVNITSTPKGKWYCPQCSSNMKRRNKKN